MSKASTNNPARTDCAENASGKKSKGRMVAIISAVLGVVTITALVVVIITLLGKENQPAPVVVADTGGGRGTVVTPENVDELREKLSGPVEDGYYETRMNIDWVFKTAKTPSENAYVENPATNTRTVYFDLSLADTGELVYSSPYIPLGAKLTDFALDADLKAGEYPAIVTYHLVDDDENEVTNVSVSVKLQIQS